MARLRKADVTQWLGVVCLACGAVYYASQGQYEQAWNVAGAALALLGVKLKLQSTSEHLTEHIADVKASVGSVKDDTANIRDNPAMPGTPALPRARPFPEDRPDLF